MSCPCKAKKKPQPINPARDPKTGEGTSKKKEDK